MDWVPVKFVTVNCYPYPVEKQGGKTFRIFHFYPARDRVYVAVPPKMELKVAKQETVALREDVLARVILRGKLARIEILPLVKKETRVKYALAVVNAYSYHSLAPPPLFCGDGLNVYFLRRGSDIVLWKRGSLGLGLLKAFSVD